MSFEIVACPELVAPDDERCNAPAEVTRRDVTNSTNGPVELIGTLCLMKHRLFFPVYMLERPAVQPPAVE